MPNKSAKVSFNSRDPSEELHEISVVFSGFSIAFRLKSEVYSGKTDHLVWNLQSLKTL
ncbi:hypothetical protein Bealeia1_00436 [Candidatus Bealeia paramacronuclearis]|uniref:Uncharacterized protein n=1 Tax=Candidatus Bealeia paramacronuclearis TaxID=1921001 RepID=A0ABZ2C3B2_9PROT|nr:hypothetical protein [Candidatus Bealeia paramacronuclearis]